MYLIIIRNWFEQIGFLSLCILPLLIIWFIFWIIIMVKKINKKHFVRVLHRWIGILLILLFVFPIAGNIISQLCSAEQRRFVSYEYFVSAEPIHECDFPEEEPVGVQDIKYYCYHTSLQVGYVASLSLRFEDFDAAETYCKERMDYFQSEYSELKYVYYDINRTGVDSTNINEEDLVYYLEKNSELTLDDYVIVLFFEDEYECDYRWILFCEENNEIIEIVSNYSSW